MKCLILGDIHLGKGISIGKPAELGNLNSRIQDQITLLEWAYDFCIENSVKFIIITGDVYQDSKPHPAVIGLFMCWLKKCERSGIQVHVVMGNHDILRSGQYVTSALDLVSELELYYANVYKDVTRLELGGDFTVVLVPFRDKRMYETKNTEEALKKLASELQRVTQEPSDKTKVCIGHLALEGSLSIGDEISDNLNEIYVPPEMFEWFDYVWMGHIHHPQVIQHHNPYAAHVGSLDRSDLHKTEVENEKVAILLDPSLEGKFKELILPTRALRPVRVDVPPGKDSTEFVINELCLLSKKVPFKESIVKVQIQLNGPDLESVDKEKVESYLKDHLEIHHMCSYSESRTISAIQIDPEDAFDNTMEIAQTINKWAETRDHFEDEQERDEFKTAAHEIRQAWEDKYLK
jgi:exonuclease SbcD